MPYEFQIAVDSRQPHEQAAWWAETLGWLVEAQDEDFIRKMIAEGYASDEDTMTHNGRLVWREGAAIRHPEVPAGPTGRRVLFQAVPEATSTVPKTKNKLHLDLRVGEDDVETVVARLKERGATFLWNGSQGPHTWVTMADPEGNEFCVSK